MQLVLIRDVLLRRWRLAALGLLLTLLLCDLAAVLVPAQHQAVARVLLLPPAGTVENGGNPYLALNGLGTTASIVSQALSDETTASAIRGRGAQGNYVVEPDPAVSGPVLLITVEAKTSKEALTTLRVLVDEVPLTLVRLQSTLAAPTSAYISASLLTSDHASHVLRKSQLRAVLLALVVGLGATVFGTALFDRSRRYHRAPTGRSDEPTGLTGTDQPHEPVVSNEPPDPARPAGPAASDHRPARFVSDGRHKERIEATRQLPPEDADELERLLAVESIQHLDQ